MTCATWEARCADCAARRAEHLYRGLPRCLLISDIASRLGMTWQQVFQELFVIDCAYERAKNLPWHNLIITVPPGTELLNQLAWGAVRRLRGVRKHARGRVRQQHVWAVLPGGCAARRMCQARRLHGCGIIVGALRQARAPSATR